MAFLTGQTWYAGSTKWTAVAAWAASTAYTAGQLVRQLATPAVGSERVFACVVAGTSGGSEPAWTTTHGAKTAADGTVTWQDVTGKAAVNGDATNTFNWTNGAKSTTPSVGVIIKNVTATHYFICTTSGAAGTGSEPSWNTTAGATTTDASATWTSLGAVGAFAAWAAPAARLNLFCATGFFSVPGDLVYVSHNHAETQAAAIAYTGTNSGTPSKKLVVLCVNDSAAPPTALATTGSVSTTGANTLSYGSNYYTYGLVFNGGSGAVTNGLSIGGSTGNVFENCAFNKPSTTAGTIGLGGGTGSDNEFTNCTFALGAAGDQVALGTGRLRVRGGSVAASGTVPTICFFANGAPRAEFDGVDLSAVTGTLITAGSSSAVAADVYLKNCKLGSGVTRTPAGTNTPYGLRLFVHNSDSGATNYTESGYIVLGSSQQETAIVRTGGASNGTTAMSLLVASGSTASYYQPFLAGELSAWQDATGSSRTATVELTTDTALTDADCWMELEYLGSSATPVATIATTRVAPLGTAAALATSSAVWGGTAKTFKYKLSVAFTPQMKGPVLARVYLGKASTTIYVDPLIVVT